MATRNKVAIEEDRYSASGDSFNVISDSGKADGHFCDVREEE